MQNSTVKRDPLASGGRAAFALVLWGATMAGPARAEQCTLVSQDHANAALLRLKKGGSFSIHCLPCGQALPTAPATIGQVEMRPSGGLSNSFEVVVNGDLVDLAYTYVKTGKREFTNVGTLVGCRAEDVPTTLALDKKSMLTAPSSRASAPRKDDVAEAALPSSPGGVFGMDEKPTGVTGGLDANAVVNAIRTRKGAVIACYERALKRNPKLAGRVDLQFTIDKGGRVSSAAIEKSTLDDESVGKCMSTVVKGWRFPSPSGASMTFSFPFVFEVDTDHDGVPDSRDKCPRHREDYDGALDSDGCPE